MTNTRKLAKNTFFLTLANVFPKFFMIFFTVYAARKLGSEGLGEYAIATSLVGLFSVLADLGLNNLFIREVARRKDRTGQYLGSMLVLKAGLAVVVLLSIIPTTKFLAYNNVVEQTIYLLAIGLVLSSFVSLLTALFQAYEKMEYNAILGTLNSALLTAGGIAALYFGYGVIGLGWVSLLSSLVVLVVTVAVVRRKFSWGGFAINWNFLSHLARESVPFALIAIFITIYYRSDMLLLSKLPIGETSNEVAVGLYSASYKFVDTLQMVPAVVTGAAFPLFARLYTQDKASLQAIYQRILKYLVFLGIPMAVGTTLLAKPIIRLAFGTDFIRSADALVILIWAVVLIFINTLFATVLTSMNKMRILVILGGMNVVFSVTLNLLLIPTWGLGLSFIGASLTTLFTEILGFVLYYLYFSERIHRVKIFSPLWKSMTASLVMGGFIVFANYHLLVSVVLSPLIYFGLLYLLGGFNSVDRKVILNLLRFKKKGGLF